MTPPLSTSASIDVACPPDALWDLVTDVARIGEWSPVCVRAEWRDGDGPHVGAVIIGHNDDGRTQWDSSSVVVAAERGREFAWEVGEGYARWSYTLEPTGTGTRLTESWEFLPAGIAFFRTTYGTGADDRIALRAGQAVDGIPPSLAAIKQIAESG